MASYLQKYPKNGLFTDSAHSITVQPWLTRENGCARSKTVSTFPPKDIFTKDAKTIAKAMASKKVSPKGIGSGIRMIQFFINRAGKNLSTARKRELEKAKKLLQTKVAKEK